MQIANIDDLGQATEILKGFDWHLDAAASALLEDTARPSRRTAQSSRQAARSVSPPNVESNCINHPLHPPASTNPIDQFFLDPLRSLTQASEMGGNKAFYMGVSASKLLSTQLHGLGVLPPLTQTSYADALKLAFRSKKLLVVYVHAPLHPDTNAFVEHILCAPTLKTCLQDDFLLWAGDVQHPEGYFVSEQLKAYKFPFLGVVQMQELQSLCLCRQGPRGFT